MFGGNQAGYLVSHKEVLFIFFLRVAIINFSIIGSYFLLPSTIIIDTSLYAVINDWLIDARDIYYQMTLSLTFDQLGLLMTNSSNQLSLGGRVG